MVRKGRLEEIFSRALHSADDPNLYLVSYRDFGSTVETTIPEFVKISENFSLIPASRIMRVKRQGEVLYEKRIPSHP